MSELYEVCSQTSMCIGHLYSTLYFRPFTQISIFRPLNKRRDYRVSCGMSYITFKFSCFRFVYPIDYLLSFLSLVLKMRTREAENRLVEQSLEQENVLNSPYTGRDGTKVYKRRWYILCVYCLIAILQNIMWNTWGPIQATARAVYGWDDYVIDLMAAWGSITFCIAMVPFAWIMDVKGRIVYLLFCLGTGLIQ